MKMSLNGLIELAGHEGVCLSPYLDSVGVVTIGFGATRSEIPGLSLSHRDITMKEAVDLFTTGIVKYENAVNKALKVDVSQEQFDALTSICYNIGTGGLSGSTFIKRINAKSFVGSLPKGFMDVPLLLSELDRTDRVVKYYETSVHGFLTGSVVDAIMMWTKPKEITNRRKKEAKLFSTGVYSNGGKCLVFPTNGRGRTLYAKGKTINVKDYL